MTCSLLPREILWRHISKTGRAIILKFCMRNAFIAITTHAKFHFNWLMLTLIFGIWASEPPRAWRTTERAGPDGVKYRGISTFFDNFLLLCLLFYSFRSKFQGRTNICLNPITTGFFNLVVALREWISSPSIKFDPDILEHWNLEGW